MATTYSTSLKLALIGDGDQSGIWGQTTNTNLGSLLEQAITGVQTITMSDANYTLSTLNGIVDEARNAVLVVTGTNNAVRDLIPPVVEKLYVIYNNTTGGYAIRVIGSSGTGVNVPNGTYSLIYCNGTNFIQISNSNNIAGTLGVSGATTLSAALTYGGVTLSNSVTGTGSMVLSASPALTGTPTATTAAVGTNTTQIATTAFVQAALPSGVIVMWSGSIASIPSGWYLCNGSNGTPDLRNRFIVGAGDTYAVAATGGSANATLVSHTHTASVSDPGHNHLLGLPGQYPVYGTDAYRYGYQSPFSSWSGFRFVYSNADPGYDGYSQTKTTDISVSNSTEGSSATNANLPPYYALAYIMKA
jgi:hypothetical protein